MSPKQWLALLCFYVTYLFFGASIFYYIEHGLELEQRANDLEQRIEINELLVKYTSPEDEKIQNNVLDKVSGYCGKPVTNYTLDEYPTDFIWTFFHAFWFSFIVCSTVGYGNISPHDPTGQIFLIFYALVGLPVNGFLLAYLGDFFSKTFIGIYSRYKEYKHATTKNYTPQKFGMIGRVALFLVPGITFFIFLPACLYTYFEEWPYVTSVYYSFVTLTTIGFGDYVPTFQDGQARKFGIYFTLYQIFIIFWFIVGLGYFIMIIGFIAKGMQSKRIARLEHQLSENIKSTQNRIWTEVTKDVSILRSILNDVHLMKFKPVYTDSTEDTKFNSLRRSSSCPDLVLYRDLSENYRRNSDNSTEQRDSSTINTLNRVQSEGDLSRIDKEKTFEGAENVFKTGELLSRVVNALDSIRPADEDGQSCLELGMDSGLHGFSDAEILASEKTMSGWSLAQSDVSYANPPIRRRRAASDFHLPNEDGIKNSYEWTWNGNNAHIKEYIKNKSRQYSTASMFPPKIESNNRSVALNIPDDLSVPTGTVNRSFISKINPFKSRLLSQDGKRHSVASQDMTPQMYLEKTSKGRDSRKSLPHAYLSATARGRSSVFSILEQPLSTPNTDILEKTTIADLIRAIEIMHTKANLSSDTHLYDDVSENSKRKTSSTAQSLQLPTNRSRRGSLRPVSDYTTIFSSQGINNANKAATFSRRPTNPPPYAETQASMAQRSNVRTANSSMPSGQSYTSHQGSLTLPQKSSLRPSLLARNIPSQASGRRYSRQSSQPPLITVNRSQPQSVTTRNLLWRPAQLHASRSRHGSLSEQGDTENT